MLQVFDHNLLKIILYIQRENLSVWETPVEIMVVKPEGWVECVEKGKIRSYSAMSEKNSDDHFHSHLYIHFSFSENKNRPIFKS